MAQLGSKIITSPDSFHNGIGLPFILVLSNIIVRQEHYMIFLQLTSRVSMTQACRVYVPAQRFLSRTSLIMLSRSPHRVLQLRRKVTPTESEIDRRNSRIVRNAFASSSIADGWLMEEEE